MGDSRLACCLQGGGGGVSVFGGTVTIVNSQIYSNTASEVRASHACKLPIALMGDSRFARCSQGGGIRVGVYGRSVTIVNSQIYSNTASNVCNRLQNFPSPRWKNG